MNDAQYARDLVLQLTAHAAVLDSQCHPNGGLVRRGARWIAEHADAPDDDRACLYCGEPLVPKPRGRPPQYCPGDRCRAAAWRQRKRERERNS